jgi:hypothetical protein
MVLVLGFCRRYDSNIVGWSLFGGWSRLKKGYECVNRRRNIGTKLYSHTKCTYLSTCF